MRPIAFYTETFDDPALDIAVSKALMDMVADSFPYDTLRIYQPPEMLALGRLDYLSDGYRDILGYCREADIEPVIRISGGRAVLFHGPCLALAWARRESLGTLDVDKRVQPLNDIYLSTLRQLGVDAKQGQLEGEYCPGDSTINARGQVKLIGTGQRATAGSGYLGSIITCGQSQAMADQLHPVYQSLGLDFNKGSCGAVCEEANIDIKQIVDGLINSFALKYEIVEMPLPLSVFRRARDLISQYRISY